MELKKTLVRTTLAVAMAGTASVLIAPAAQAAAPPLLITKPDGTWKARAQYNPDTNKFCTRVYNGTSGAVSRLYITEGGSLVGFVQDVGGDESPQCVTVNRPAGRSFKYDLYWDGTGDLSGHAWANGTY